MVFYRLAHGEKLKKAGHAMVFYQLAQRKAGRECYHTLKPCKNTGGRGGEEPPKKKKNRNFLGIFDI